MKFEDIGIYVGKDPEEKGLSEAVRTGRKIKAKMPIDSDGNEWYDLLDKWGKGLKVLITKDGEVIQRSYNIDDINPCLAVGGRVIETKKKLDPEMRLVYNNGKFIEKDLTDEALNSIHQAYNKCVQNFKISDAFSCIAAASRALLEDKVTKDQVILLNAIASETGQDIEEIATQYVATSEHHHSALGKAAGLKAKYEALMRSAKQSEVSGLIIKAKKEFGDIR